MFNQFMKKVKVEDLIPKKQPFNIHKAFFFFALGFYLSVSFVNYLLNL
jgi:hypothetical protein